MNDLELERAAIAPHRSIELCDAAGAFQKRHSSDFSEMLHLRTRIIDKDAVNSDFFYGARWEILGDRG